VNMNRIHGFIHIIGMRGSSQVLDYMHRIHGLLRVLFSLEAPRPWIP
jgi:hypothetical protein